MPKPTQQELLNTVLALVESMQTEEGEGDEKDKKPAGPKNGNGNGKMSRGQKIEKATNWTTIISAIVVGVLSYYNGEDAEKAALQAKLDAAEAEVKADEASKEEKASASYELIVGALKDQQADIRELRIENRALRREIHELSLSFQPEPMAMMVMSDPSCGSDQDCDAGHVCIEGTCREHLVTKVVKAFSNDEPKKKPRPVEAEETGPPEPEPADHLPTKLEEHPKIKKAIKARKERVRKQVQEQHQMQMQQAL